MATRSRLDQALLKISLAAACLMFVLPFLNPRHYAPIPSFYAEWAAAVLLLISGITFLRRITRARPLVPKIVLLPTGLVMIVLVQGLLGQWSQKEASIFFMLYMLGAALAMIVGQSLRQELGLHRLMLALASCLLVGTLASALLATLSLYAPSWLPHLVENELRQTIARGNLMQRNHLANYLCAGVAAACFLHLSRRMTTGWLIAALAPLLSVVAMTQSRSPLIYIIGFNLVSLLWLQRSRTKRAKRLLVITLCLIPAFFAAQYFPTMKSGTATEVVIDEVSEFFKKAEEPISNSSIKIKQSLIGLAMFVEKPLLGNGIASYYWRSFALAEQFAAPAGMERPGEHAHNLVAHLLAELGIGSLLVLVIPLAIWWRGVATHKWSPATVWVLLVLMIETWHSMVEYPLWYAFFLLPTALLLGAADNDAITLKPASNRRWMAGVILLSGALVLNSLRSDYLRLEYALNRGLETRIKRTTPLTFADINPGLLGLYENSLFAPYVGLIYAMTIKPTRELLDEKLELTEQAAHFIPAYKLVFNYALLLALAERHDEAVQIQRWAIRCYPDRLSSYIREVEALLAEDRTLLFYGLLQEARTAKIAKPPK